MERKTNQQTKTMEKWFYFRKDVKGQFCFKIKNQKRNTKERQENQ